MYIYIVDLVFNKFYLILKVNICIFNENFMKRWRLKILILLISYNDFKEGLCDCNC